VDSSRVMAGYNDAVEQSEGAARPSAVSGLFHAEVTKLFNVHFSRLHRFLNRLSADPELSADLAQETFVRLYRRGSLPDAPEAWLITVAMNLLRNARAGHSRRRRLLTVTRGERAHSDRPPLPDDAVEGADVRRRVRGVLDSMPERDRHLLLLRAEGYSYRDIARSLEINEGSVGVLLARAKRAFRESYEDAFDAP
jgi:RNA polymerase sigma-70 factor, ECF subfamily